MSKCNACGRKKKLTGTLDTQILPITVTLDATNFRVCDGCARLQSILRVRLKDADL
jgi:hypothetical protein